MSRSKRQTGRSVRGRPATSARSRKGTQELRPEEWAEFLDQFSRDHEGWLMEMDIVPAAGRPSVEVRELPFAGVSLNSRNPRDRKVIVTLGDEAEDHIAHTINRAKAIRLSEEEQQLEIDSESGSKVMLKWTEER